MRHALQRLVAEVTRLAAPDHWIDLQVGEAAQTGQRSDNRRRIGDLVLGQVAGLRARIGNELLALAVVELLRDRKGLVGGPTPALAAGLLQRRQVEQARRPLSTMLDRHAERPGVVGRGFSDQLRPSAILNTLLWRRGMPHREAAVGDLGGGNNLEIVLDAEVADFQLAHTNNGEGRRLHAAYPNDAFCAVSNQHLSCSAGQREIEDLIGLLARHGGLVERAELAVWFEGRERLA